MRYPVIDIIRIIAIGVVFFSHSLATFTSGVQQSVGIPGVYWMSIGEIGAAITLLVSGLLLMSLYKDKIDIRKFYKKRITHIYTTYLVCLVLIALLTNGWWRFMDPLHLFCQVTATCSFMGLMRDQLITPSWFIGTIICLYLLFPVLRSLLIRNKFVFLVITIPVPFFLRIYLDPLNADIIGIIKWLPPIRFFEFGVGMVCGYYLDRIRILKVQTSEKTAKRLYELAGWSFPLFLLHVPLIRTYFLAGVPMSILFSIFVYYIVKEIRS